LKLAKTAKSAREGCIFMADDDQRFYDLLRGIKAGSEEAARQFLTQYGKYIRHVVRRHMMQKLRAKFDSEDFLQDVCVSFFSDPPSPKEFSDPAALLAFLGKIARNKVTDASRQRLAQRCDVNRENSLDGSAKFAVENLETADPTPSEAVTTDERWEALAQGGHPDQKKLLNMLRNGYTQEEIARVLGLSVRQVQRLVQKLRERFNENEPG
jgi:RNA polymerase sigma factor (sigma-70 family)